MFSATCNNAGLCMQTFQVKIYTNRYPSTNRNGYSMVMKNEKQKQPKTSLTPHPFLFPPFALLRVTLVDWGSSSSSSTGPAGVSGLESFAATITASSVASPTGEWLSAPVLDTGSQVDSPALDWELRMFARTFVASLSSPFHVPQPPHRQRPSSSRVRTPGGAWPLTSRHARQINATRFLGCVSSSPKRTSKSRSYQWDCSIYWEDLGKAFGANPGSSTGCCGSGG